jgi:chromosome segregation ATPase
MELVRTLDNLKETSKSLKPSLETFTEGFKDIEMIRTQCELLDETKVSVNNKEEKLKGFKVQLREHEKSINTLKQQIVNNEKQYQKQIQTMKQINNGLKKELETKLKNKSDTEKNSLEERIRLEKRLDNMVFEHKKFKESLDFNYKQHLASVEMVKNLVNNRLNEFKNIKQK